MSGAGTGVHGYLKGCIWLPEMLNEASSETMMCTVYTTGFISSLSMSKPTIKGQQVGTFVLSKLTADTVYGMVDMYAAIHSPMGRVICLA